MGSYERSLLSEDDKVRHDQRAFTAGMSVFPSMPADRCTNAYEKEVAGILSSSETAGIVAINNPHRIPEVVINFIILSKIFALPIRAT